jgi:hypothetical protein
MKNKKFFANYSGSGSSLTINDILRFGHVDDLVINPNYFRRHFHKINEKFFDYFDFTIKESPSIYSQRFTFDCPDSGEILQGEIIEILKKNDIYQEYTLCHIVQILHFPSFNEINLSVWRASDCFLLKNKYGNLCWVVLTVKDWDIFSCPDGPKFYLEVYDFEDDKKIPEIYINGKHKNDLFRSEII